MNLKKKPIVKNQIPLFPQTERPKEIVLEDLRWMTKKQIYGGVLPGKQQEEASVLVKLLTAGKTDDEE